MADAAVGEVAEQHLAVLLNHAHTLVNVDLKRALGALHSDMLRIDLDFDAVWHLDWILSNS